MPPVIVLNCVGLTPRWLPFAPRISKLAATGWVRSLTEVLPAVTCSAQATLLTGELPQQHGIVANGWHFRDTEEVRFWQQSNRLIQAEPLYETARQRATVRGQPFRCAKLFWWYNQGAPVDISLTPKPWYGADGNKAFDISGTPLELPTRLKAELGPFPFPSFWGPMAGVKSTAWIAQSAATVLRSERPDLTLVYLPHLDYDPQRFGPSGTDMARCVQELDDCCEPILDAAQQLGAQVWIVSEYGHCDVSRPIYLNRVLHQAGWITTRRGPFGDQLDLYQSRAFAVCDHQLAHVTIRNAMDFQPVRELLQATPGVAAVYAGAERAAIGLDHPRSGEIIALSDADAWFAYPFWPDDAFAPDYARTVAIHAKPGYDPCELFFDPQLKAPKLYAAAKVARKKLGFRMLMDVIPLDASIVRGSHGLRAAHPQDAPLFVGHGAAPEASVPMTAVRDYLLAALGLGEDSNDN
jgi:predicted AlkP superfamily pyrophosphatase or phosphodiesterase